MQKGAAMNDTKRMRLPEWLTAGVAFVYYFIMALYKLTYAPIWQDEAMEFYCSLPVRGPIRGVTEYATMYERMVKIQQQPPLYNWVMCLWLRISESAWWYRFSSVVMGFVAALGLYFVIRKLCDRYMAAFCVVIYSSIYIIMYYMKEASEYAMLLMFSFWLIYAYMLICDRITIKRLAAFMALCILAVYTHYGAVFAVVPMAVSVLIMPARQKDWGKFKAVLGMETACVVFGGVPVVALFLLPQLAKNASTYSAGHGILIENGNIVGDFFFSIASVFRWCVLDIDRDAEKIGMLIDVLGAVIFVIIVFVVINTKKKAIRSFFFCNVVTFMIYYVVTKLNMYAYGWYGNRYNMFIFPMWFVMIAISLYEFVIILGQADKKAIIKLSQVIKYGMIVSGILFGLYGDYRISNHWWKMDLRVIVDKWYEDEGYNVPTMLDFHQRYAFVYYFTHDKRYNETQWENIKWNDDLETYSTHSFDIWQGYMYETYQNELPEELYLVTGQYNSFVEALEDLGYEAEDMIDTTAKLYHMTLAPDKQQTSAAE